MAAPSSIAQITNHVAAAQAQLLQRFKDGVTVNALVAAFAGRTQVLENALWGILTQRFFSGNPFGQQLDAIGRLIGLSRQGLSDAVYTQYLQAQILVNQSGGTITDIDKVMAVAANAGSSVAVVEYFPMGIEVRVGAVAQTNPMTLGALLTRTKSASIGARLIYNTDTDANSFTLETLATYLTTGYSSGVTSLAVSSTTGWPSSGSITIDAGTSVAETVTYSAASGGAITCAATAYAHSSGAAVQKTATAGTGIDASSVGTVTTGASAGATSLVTNVSGYAGTGTIIIAEGTTVQETIAYTAFSSGTFTFAAPGLAFAHVIGDLIQLSTPVGGRLTGVYTE